MPYIESDYRKMFNGALTRLVNPLARHGEGDNNAGELNYCISSLIWKLWNKSPTYETANRLIGVLECVKQEFYRRQVAPYEDAKCQENGDLQ